MPIIDHLVRRADGATPGLSATAIGLIVGLGIIPVIILIWVVSWLFWCYPYDRSCCCTRRKKAQKDEEFNRPGHHTGRSLDSLHEKAAYPIPERPSMSYQRPDSNRLQKSDQRLSLQTVNSANTMHYTQEPKPFV